MSIPRPALAASFIVLGLALLATSPAAARETHTVAVGDIWFCDPAFEGAVCDTTVTAGDTVLWDFAGARLPHTTTHCGDSCDAPAATPLWHSGIIDDGRTFAFTFTQPGTYLYYCQVHPQLQRGRITVLDAPAQPTDTPAPDAATSPAAGPTPDAQSLPATGAGDARDGSSTWPAVSFAVLGLLGVASGLALRARLRG